MVSNLLFITSTLKYNTYTDRQFLTEAKNLGLNVLALNPNAFSYSVNRSNNFIIWNKDKEFHVPLDSIVYRKSISKAGVGLEDILKRYGATGFEENHTKKKIKGMEKFSDYVAYAEDNVKIPNSYLLTNKNQTTYAIDYFDGKFPLIVKKISGTHGIGIFVAESKRALLPIVEYLLNEGEQSPIIIQEFIEASEGKDIRIIVLDGKVVSAVLRDNTGKDFRSNIYQGASPKLIELTPEQEKIAINAAKAVGLEFAGVDVLYANEGYAITEVNSPCDFSFVEQTTKVPVTKMLIEYLINKASNK
ncbi:RimK family alpha-L-glutamate ligase [Candidatus Dojkabacteria bacterium]|nr:RimK family alpha-L-glutamate ligase [Candidatus Dojkabacteria bacterium]